MRYINLHLYRAIEAACAAYASLNLSLLHYIILHLHYITLRENKWNSASFHKTVLAPILHGSAATQK